MVVQRDREAVAVAHLSNIPEISLVVPLLNEAENIGTFLDSLSNLRSPKLEIIFVDGGSTDSTVSQLQAFVQNHSNSILLNTDIGRARQMNHGAKAAMGKVLLFLHGDTLLPLNFFDEVGALNKSSRVWGRFDVRFNNPMLGFSVIAWFMNVRSKLTGIATGDQAIFVRREVFQEIGGFADQFLMEDVELSSNLKRHSRPLCIKLPVLTSARKWEQEGIIKTVLLMWRLRIAYKFGQSPQELVKRYYS